jgi:hypothetical protein
MSQPVSLDFVAGLAEQLPLADQKRLAKTLLRGTAGPSTGPVRRRWRDIRGTAQHPLCGRDAQEWVSQSRQEDEAHSQTLGRKPA